MWQLIDNPALSTQDVGRDINCLQEDNNINVSTQVTVEISKDKEVEFNEKFNIVFPTIRGQCLNTKDFQLVKESLIAEIEQSFNPTDVINNFLDNYSNIINGSQKKQLVEMIDSAEILSINEGKIPLNN